MKRTFSKILKVFVVCAIIICTYSFCVFADIIEIKDGIKTTHAAQPTTLINTINQHYTFKWALDKRGDWRLYIRKLNGKLINLSNKWVNLLRYAVDENGSIVPIIDMYYFDYYEKMATGWYIDLNGDTYFFNINDGEQGRMVRGWHKIGEDFYYFSDAGILQRNIITVDGFYVDGEGKWK